MNLRKFKRDEPSVNVTSLIDVVLLLLIFFMLSTTFNRESEILIDLPQAKAQPKQELPQPISLIIDKQGRYYVQQQQVINSQLSTLKRALQLAIGNREDPPLIISADAEVPYQSVVIAMDAARQLGIVHLSIATRQSADEN